MPNLFKRAGKVLAAAAVIVLLWRGLLILVTALLLVTACGYAAQRWRRLRAVTRFREACAPHGKDLLLVYSNSPHWQRYVEDTWLPRWGHRAVVLNWSERRSWDPRRVEVVLFSAFAGFTEMNPLAIVVPARGRHVHIVRFWRAFRDHKHGKPQRLRAAETELEGWLEPRR